MNKKRLLKLAKLLEKDADNEKGIKFDLAQWAAPSEQDTFGKKKKVVPVSCETTACAVGLACISGAFKDEGLKHSYVTGYSEGWILVPKFGTERNFDAVISFFDITRHEADYLFSRDYYPESKTKGAKGERYVAKRIRKFVETGKSNTKIYL